MTRQYKYCKNKISPLFHPPFLLLSVYRKRRKNFEYAQYYWTTGKMSITVTKLNKHFLYHLGFFTWTYRLATFSVEYYYNEGIVCMYMLNHLPT